MRIIIGNNVQIDGDVPNYEIMHPSIAYPVITRAALGKQVFLIQRDVSTVFYPVYFLMMIQI